METTLVASPQMKGKAAPASVFEMGSPKIFEKKPILLVPTARNAPVPPPLPTEESMNKHYLSRDKTLENAKDSVTRAATYVTEVVQDVKASTLSSLPASFTQTSSSSSVPLPPPLPTEEMMNKHYLVPQAPPMPTSEQMNKHYLSRDKTLENAKDSVSRAATYVTEVVKDVKQTTLSSLPASFSQTYSSSSSSIPVPPPLPTEEMMHKHYLVPQAPPMPTAESTNLHYLSRDKTLENAKDSVSRAATFVTELAQDVKLTALDSLPSTQAYSSSSIPVPPPLPTKQMMHKHYLVPQAPPMPRMELLNKHYLSRDKTLENAKDSVSRAATYVTEVVQDVTESFTQSSSSSIPVPPPLPTREMMHKHYLVPKAPPMPTAESTNLHYLSRNKTLEKTQGFFQTAANFVSEVAHELVEDAKYYAHELAPATGLASQSSSGIPVPPPLPTEEMMNKHYLVPQAPPMPTSEQMNKHYLSRNKTLENTGSMFQSAAHFVSEVAHELVEDAKYYANAATAPLPSLIPVTAQSSGIPVPPPLPTREMLNKHYLVPQAPPMPTASQMNKHYLSRNKTLENTGNMLQSATHFVSEVAQELVQDAKYYANAASVPLASRSSAIPVPPPLPTREMMNKHYLVPVPPPLPTREMMHKHYLVPQAPPMPRMELLNKHYLSRDKTLENASRSVQHAATFVSEVAQDLVQDAVKTIKGSVPLLSTQQSSGIPIPPPLPTREMMHKHYLTPLAPPMPSDEAMNKHYLSRNKTLENANRSIHNAATYVTEIAQDAVQTIKESVPVLSTAQTSSIPIPPPLPTQEMMNKHYLTKKPVLVKGRKTAQVEEKKEGLISSLFHYAGDAAKGMLHKVENMASIKGRTEGSSIPVPPPLPTEEMMHKHYLVPQAPPMPTSEATNAHYLSRNKTLEKTGSYLHNAAVYMKEVLEDVKEYINESTEELQPNLIPLPPVMPLEVSRDSSIPQAPPMPSKESTHKHYLSRNKSIENAQSLLKKAAHIAAEIVEDTTGYIVLKGKEGYEALPTSAELAYVANEAKGAVTERTMNAVETVENKLEEVRETALEAKETIVEKVIELKDSIIPHYTPEKEPFHVPYARYEVLDESSIWKSQLPKPFYNRRILPRTSTQQDSLLDNRMEVETLAEKLNEVLSHRESQKTMFDYKGNTCFMPHKQENNWSAVESSF